MNHTVIPIKIYSDSKSAIATAKDKKVTSENKHYDVKLLIIREWIDSGFIKLEYIDTNRNLADCLTKPLVKGKFEKLIKLMLKYWYLTDKSSN